MMKIFFICIDSNCCSFVITSILSLLLLVLLLLLLLLPLHLFHIHIILFYSAQEQKYNYQRFIGAHILLLLYFNLIYDHSQSLIFMNIKYMHFSFLCFQSKRTREKDRSITSICIITFL